LAALAHDLEFVDTGLQARVVGVDAERETRVRECVFMTTINLRGPRHRAQLQHRVPHLLHGAFEDPPATQREQSVAAKQRVGIREPERDMAFGMTRRLVDRALMATDIDGIALDNGDIHVGDPRGFRLRTDQSGAVFLGQPGIAAGVIEMMMGVENMGQLPAPGRQRGFHGLCFRGVDDGGHARIGVMRQIDVIVGHRGNQNDLERGHVALSVSFAGGL
jgi:hypothetical protein